ncbi:Fe-S cluster assembly protein SufD [Asaia krungthepensis]|uniref:Iron-sulfur assembly protein SufD n=1 Tax=Asaia krungthepensis NRIC 0535 TaxID=1307925 RepID=A0ABQ0Q1N6_9PROT|nr:Fe-S cluster assembly protein SufD [Asaia krungthepensis]GBQ87115.1 iron-sulfur assembly protein SufD [Asaia krungthepensis NRIC 0535]
MSESVALSPALGSFLARAHEGEARELLARQGLPQRRLEAWRYTPLRDVDRIGFEPPAHVSLGEAEALLARLAPEARSGFRVVFVNGVLVPELTRLPEAVILTAPDAPLLADRPLSVLNSALQQPGLSLTVPAGVEAGQICLVSLVSGEEPVSTHLAHQVTLEKEATLTLLDIQSGEGAYLANPSLTVSVAEGAHLTHLRVQQDDVRATNLTLVNASIAEHGTYDSFTLTLGSRLSRHEVLAHLGGKHATVHVNAAQLLAGTQHADLTSVITHAAPDCNSRQTVKNVLMDAAHGVFQGKIYVDRIAQKTDGYQMNQALLLSEKAQIDSKPELEIYADDVKCSHGATVGALDDEQLFYLRARGVPYDTAKAMLVRAFLLDALSLVTDEAAYALLDQRVEAWWLNREG